VAVNVFVMAGGALEALEEAFNSLGSSIFSPMVNTGQPEM